VIEGLGLHREAGKIRARPKARLKLGERRRGQGIKVTCELEGPARGTQQSGEIFTGAGKVSVGCRELGASRLGLAFDAPAIVAGGFTGARETRDDAHAFLKSRQPGGGTIPDALPIECLGESAPHFANEFLSAVKAVAFGRTEATARSILQEATSPRDIEALRELNRVLTSMAARRAKPLIAERDLRIGEELRFRDRALRSREPSLIGLAKGGSRQRGPNRRLLGKEIGRCGMAGYGRAD
jgi:hypothetical protein